MADRDEMLLQDMDLSFYSSQTEYAVMTTRKFEVLSGSTITSQGRFEWRVSITG